MRAAEADDYSLQSAGLLKVDLGRIRTVPVEVPTSRLGWQALWQPGSTDGGLCLVVVALTEAVHIRPVEMNYIFYIFCFEFEDFPRLRQGERRC
jgi:hypothetical protein